MSYNEMENMIETILEKQSILQENGVEMCSVEERIMDGAVLMTIRNFSEEKAETARQLLQCSYLQVVEAQEDQGTQESLEIQEYAAVVRGGNWIYCNDAPDLGSTYGFAATRGNEAGFVIAGHAGNKEGLTVSNGSTVIGTVTKMAYSFLSTADAAFVKASGITLSN